MGSRNQIRLLHSRPLNQLLLMDDGSFTGNVARMVHTDPCRGGGCPGGDCSCSTHHPRAKRGGKDKKAKIRLQTSCGPTGGRPTRDRQPGAVNTVWTVGAGAIPWEERDRSGSHGLSNVFGCDWSASTCDGMIWMHPACVTLAWL